MRRPLLALLPALGFGAAILSSCARDGATVPTRAATGTPVTTPGVYGHAEAIGGSAASMTGYSASEHVTALAGSTQTTRWFYFQDTQLRWFIVDGGGNVYELDDVGAQYSGSIGWRPINSGSGAALAFPPYTAAGRNFSATISSDGLTVSFGAYTGTTLPNAGLSLPNSTRAIKWLYFLNPSTGWYITDVADATRVYYLDRADWSIVNGIGWQPVSNAVFPNYPDAAYTFSSVTHSLGNQSTTFGSASRAAPTVTVSVSQTTVASGQSVVVSWSSAGATACSGNWSGASNLGLSGSASVSLTQTSTLSVTCSGPGGTASDSKTVTVPATTGGSLGAPTLGSPANGSTSVSINPTFTWSNVPGATRYWLTVAANLSDLPTNVNATSCQQCIISGNTNQSSYVTPDAFPYEYHTHSLAAGSTYYWKVQGYVPNGTQGAFSAVGSFTTASTSGGGNYVDDYPFPNQSPSSSDPYTIIAGEGFYYRECTSFVAWRLNRDAGTRSAPYFFTNHMSGGHWGDASNWVSNAGFLHYSVNHTPAVGSVAWFSYGHVAYVEHVNTDGSVDVSEYNYHTTTNPHTYSARLGVIADWYIHILR